MKTKRIVVLLVMGLVIFLVSAQSAFAGTVEIVNNSQELISVATSADGDRHIEYVNAGGRGREIQFVGKGISKIVVAKQPNEAKRTPFTPLKIYDLVDKSTMMKNFKVIISSPANGEGDVNITEVGNTLF